MLVALFSLCLMGEAGWISDTSEFEDVVVYVRDLVVLPDGRVFFSDTREGLVHRLDDAGQSLGAFGTKGEGPGEWLRFNRIQWLPELQNLAVYADRNKINFFDGEGNYLKTIRTNQSNFRFHLINEKQGVWVRMENPFGDWKGEQGADIILADFDAMDKGRVLLHNSFQEHGDPWRIITDGGGGAMSFSWTPYTLWARHQQHLIMGSTRGVDFTIYDLEQEKVVGKLTDPRLKGLPVTDEEIENDQGWIQINNKDYRAKDTKHPEIGAALGNLLAATDGRVWVSRRETVVSDDLIWWVYNRDGSKAGSLTVPVGERIRHVDGTHLWKIVYEEDEEDERWLIVKQAYTLK